MPQVHHNLTGISDSYWLQVAAYFEQQRNSFEWEVPEEWIAMGSCDGRVALAERIRKESWE